MHAAEVVALCVAAYLIGSFPSGVVVGNLLGRDVRRSGSGNIGAANVSRVVGRRAAVSVLVLDIAKGAAPVLIARGVGLSSPELAAVAGLAVLGHDYSLFLRFSGGKGVATTIGALFPLVPAGDGAAAALWIIVMVATRYSSLASMASLCALPAILWLMGMPAAYVILATALAFLALFKHRENIDRLRNGKEPRFGEG